MVFWTDNSIRKVAAETAGKVAAEVAVDVVSGTRGAESVRKHVSEILRGSVVADVGMELRSRAETIAEGAKASLHRRLNAIYAAHSEKLEQKLKQFEREFEDREPDQKQRLERLRDRLTELEADCENWLAVPQQQLERAAADRRQTFSDELNKLANSSETRVKGMITRVEIQLSELVEEQLHDLLLEAVREHVVSRPYEPDGLSNKQIAAARRISLRKAKRLRRLGIA